ncbi:hypothetical protein Tco_1191269 [Tanacetum coccineum]
MLSDCRKEYSGDEIPTVDCGFELSGGELILKHIWTYRASCGTPYAALPFAIIGDCWTDAHSGRRFYSCLIQGSQCRWIYMVDPPMCLRFVQIIPGLLRARSRHEASIQELSDQVLKLKKYLLIISSSECVNLVVLDATYDNVGFSARILFSGELEIWNVCVQLITILVSHIPHLLMGGGCYRMRGASRSAQPPKDDEQSTQKKQDSEASASRQHLAFTSTVWQITDTRDAAVDSSTHKSDPESKHSEQSSDNIPMQDEGHFCRQTGKKKLCKADLEGLTFNLVKAFHKNSVSLQFQMDECHKLLTSKVDLVNPEGHQILHNIYEPLPLGGPLVNASMTSVRPMVPLTGGLEERNSTSTNTVSDYKEYKISEKDFKNLHPNDFEDLFLLNIQEKLNHLPKTYKTSLHTAVNMWIRNLVIRNRVGDLQLGIESYQTKINLECPNWDAADYYFKEDYTIVPKPRSVVYRDRNDQRKFIRLNELHKFSDGTLTRVMEKLDHMVKDFQLFEYNKGMETRKWSEDDKRRSKDFITAIEKRLQIRRIF